MQRINKKTSLLKGIYAIADTQLLNEQRLLAATTAALEGGASIIQYRDKSSEQNKRQTDALALRALCSEHQALFIINDDIALAKHCHADGVHLGKDDATIANARQQLGDDIIIGVSCYNDLTLAEHAIEMGADYVAFGSFYPSTTKPDAVRADLTLINEIKKNYAIPVCAIGGITLENATPLIDAGADMLAIINAIFASANPQTTTAALQKLLHT